MAKQTDIKGAEALTRVVETSLGGLTASARGDRDAARPASSAVSMAAAGAIGLDLAMQSASGDGMAAFAATSDLPVETPGDEGSEASAPAEAALSPDEAAPEAPPAEPELASGDAEETGEEATGAVAEAVGSFVMGYGGAVTSLGSVPVASGSPGLTAEARVAPAADPGAESPATSVPAEEGAGEEAHAPGLVGGLIGDGGVVDDLLGEDGVVDDLLDGLLGDGGVVQGVVTGVLGDGGLVDGLLGSGGLLDGIIDYDSALGSVVEVVVGEDGLLGLVYGENSLVVSLGEGLLDGLVGDDGLVDGLLDGLAGSGGLLDSVAGIFSGETGVIEGVVGGVLGEEGLIPSVVDGLLGEDGLVDSVLDGLIGDESPLGGDGLLGGVLGDDGLLGGIVGDDGLLGGVLGDDGLLGGVVGDDGLLGGVLGDDGLLGGLTGGSGLLGGLLGGGGSEEGTAEAAEIDEVDSFVDTLVSGGAGDGLLAAPDLLDGLLGEEDVFGIDADAPQEAMGDIFAGLDDLSSLSGRLVTTGIVETLVGGEGEDADPEIDGLLNDLLGEGTGEILGGSVVFDALLGEAEASEDLPESQEGLLGDTAIDNAIGTLFGAVEDLGGSLIDGLLPGAGDDDAV